MDPPSKGDMVFKKSGTDSLQYSSVKAENAWNFTFLSLSFYGFAALWTLAAFLVS
jgi:hypothetical protein